MKKEKKGIEMEMTGWWFIAIAVLVILLIAYFTFKNKGMGSIDFIKNLFRFGGN